MRLLSANVDWRRNVDHKVDDELPVVNSADVVVANATRIVDDKRDVQQTHCADHRTTVYTCRPKNGAILTVNNFHYWWRKVNHMVLFAEKRLVYESVIVFMFRFKIFFASSMASRDPSDADHSRKKLAACDRLKNGEENEISIVSCLLSRRPQIQRMILCA